MMTEEKEKAWTQQICTALQNDDVEWRTQMAAWGAVFNGGPSGHWRFPDGTIINLVPPPPEDWTAPDYSPRLVQILVKGTPPTRAGASPQKDHPPSLLVRFFRRLSALGRRG